MALKIYYALALRAAPSQRKAAQYAGVSDEKLTEDMERLGLEFVKPVRKFWGMKALPDYVVVFLERILKEFGPSFTELPPKPPPRRRSSPQPRRRRPEPGTTVV
jgi:hypothetical protein